LASRRSTSTSPSTPKKRARPVDSGSFIRRTSLGDEVL
jgi:hypothetical protein